MHAASGYERLANIAWAPRALCPVRCTPSQRTNWLDIA